MLRMRFYRQDISDEPVSVVLCGYSDGRILRDEQERVKTSKFPIDVA